MPAFVRDFNKFCARHIGWVVIALSSLLGGAAATGTAYYLPLADTVSAVDERSSNNRAQLETHIQRENDYRREVRDLLRSQSESISAIQTDVAVLISELEEEE